MKVRKETSKGKRKKRVKASRVDGAVNQKMECNGEIGAVSPITHGEHTTLCDATALLKDKQSIEVDSCGKGGVVTSSVLAEDMAIGEFLWFVLE